MLAPISIVHSQYIKIRDYVEVGRTAVLEKLAEESSLTKCLDATFGEEMPSDILARSMFQVCEGSAAVLASEWQEDVLLSRETHTLDSGAISRQEENN